ncbi:MAG: single-stranded DNA-binding protein [Magnetococcales bacterium]|nr:single-stranded DNA-binding protein [Magnetococcales bacterium]
MSRSLNRVQLIGHLGADPEIRATQDGKPIAQLNLATNESWNDMQGQRQEKTEWHRVVVFGRLAEIVQQYLRKGSQIFIEGKLQTRKWTDKQGMERYTTEVILNNFNGQMIMLGGGRSQGTYPSGGSGMPSYDYGDYSPAPQNLASNSGQELEPVPVVTATAGASGATRGKPPASAPANIPSFDDDIPF